MKSTYHKLIVQMLAIGVAFSLTTRAHAESAREELVHAYRLLEHADGDYAGHRVAAMKEVEIAGKEVGLSLHGDEPEKERQWKSDMRLKEARRLLHHAHEHLEEGDRLKVAAHVEHAIKDIDEALKVK